MSNQLTSIAIHNFCSLKELRMDAARLNLLFGPNGSGKSAFLDTIWFVRDCAIRGVDLAASDRNHGIGLLWDGAAPGENIIIQLETTSVVYKLVLGYSSGRIEPFVGETLYAKSRHRNLIDRKIGSDKAEFYHIALEQAQSVTLREPEKLALTRYLDLEEEENESSEIDSLLRFIRFYHVRATDLYSLRNRGSEASHHTWLWDRGENLWSVLRNIKDRRSLDERYDTIIEFMRAGFPNFRDLLIEQLGPNVVYGSFIETTRHHPIPASGVSDGHLQLLLHLTALFAEGATRDSIIAFDEPEISLHPHALDVFSRAVKRAAEQWNKQIFIATHSPVLISQFEPSDIIAVELGESGETQMTRISQMADIQDLLENYAVGSLYMAELIAPQSSMVQRNGTVMEIAQ